MATRRAWSRRLGGLLAAAAVLALGVTPVAADVGPGGGTAGRVGSEISTTTPTGHEVSPEFLSFYEGSGGLPVFGYPLSDSVLEGDQRVQYFERQRFELHPENEGTPYEVELGLLGMDDAKDQGLLTTAPFQPQPAGTAGADCEEFAPTGHSVCGGFLAYWHGHGLEFGDEGVSDRESLALFGYPISEVFEQNGVSVQYFERARLEYHPENPAPYDVLLGLLGWSDWQEAAPSAQAAPAMPSLGAEIAATAKALNGLPYVWGGTTPAGFDCSGFVYYVVNQVTGGGFPRDMAAQANSGVPVSTDDLQPGDLVFQQNTYQWGLSHAGIYLGDGKFISAENESIGVGISDLWDSYWGPRFYTARRITP